MNVTTLLSPRAAQRPPSTNEDLNCGHQGTLSWAVRRQEKLARITLHGELDIATAPALGAAVRPLAEAGGAHLVIDLAGLRFCDCAGLTLFVRWQSWTALTGGSLRLVAPPRIVRRLLTLTGTLDLLAPADRGR